MAAIDDSYDVHDYCVKMGLDPDRVSHLARARAAMCAEAEARWKARGGKPGKPTPMPSLAPLFVERYGAYVLNLEMSDDEPPKDEP